MAKYRKKPSVIDAMIFDRRTFDELKEFTRNNASGMAIPKTPDGKALCTIKTANGERTATEGDYIINENGFFYPCNPSIFHKLYEKSIE